MFEEDLKKKKKRKKSNDLRRTKIGRIHGKK